MKAQPDIRRSKHVGLYVNHLSIEIEEVKKMAILDSCMMVIGDP